ncbi:MAG TPA: hypothetical protein VND64_10935 [Pirellulales bacterium]|nr:hypothetical protein [Pirellulales bacterium]
MPRPFQYSLKTIFVLILLAAAFFGGMAVQRLETERALRQAQEERERAEASEMRARSAMVAEARARAVAEALRAHAGTDDGQP